MSTTAQHRRALQAHAGDRTPHRVVLAVNGDPASDSAVRWVVDRARTHVLDVDVVEVEHDRGGRTPGGPRAARSARDRLALHAPLARSRVRPAHGDRGRAILELAREADLLVLGTRRRPTGAPHLVAAFSTRIAETASCPTAVVPVGWEPSPGPVVAAVEGDGSDGAAVERAASEAAALHRDLLLVHVWRLVDALGPGLEVDLQGDPIEHGNRLDRVAAEVRSRHPELHVVRILERGDPVDALVHAGRGANLLVLGTHALGFVDRLLLRSVSRGVLERPACPVLVVPPHGSDPLRP